MSAGENTVALSEGCGPSRTSQDEEVRAHDCGGQCQSEEGEAVERDAMLKRHGERIGQRPHEREPEVGKEREQRDDGRPVRSQTVVALTEVDSGRSAGADRADARRQRHGSARSVEGTVLEADVQERLHGRVEVAKPADEMKLAENKAEERYRCRLGQRGEYNDCTDHA